MAERIGRYLMVEELPHLAGRKTNLWRVQTNDGGVLGSVEWYGPWRQYTFNPMPGTTFNSTCLMDLAMFLGEKNKAHRAARAE